MSRQCITCGEEIHPKRLEILPGTQTCVKHSTVEKKVAVTVQMGEGDHTWIETYAVERADYDKMVELETGKKQIPDLVESVFNDEESPEWNKNILDSLDDEEFPDVEEFLTKGYTEEEE
jgi:hypothetical protein